MLDTITLLLKGSDAGNVLSLADPGSVKIRSLTRVDYSIAGEGILCAGAKIL